MRALGLLGVLIVLVAVGALVAYAWSSWRARRGARRRRETPWMARDFERDGSWVVEAYRPDHESIVLASAPIQDGMLVDAVNQARSDAYQNYLALRPRGRCDLFE